MIKAMDTSIKLILGFVKTVSSLAWYPYLDVKVNVGC